MHQTCAVCSAQKAHSLSIAPARSEPQLAAVFDGTKWTATITPNVQKPLVSYPAGGWAYYEIQASMPSTSGPPTIESKYCK